MMFHNLKNRFDKRNNKGIIKSFSNSLLFNNWHFDGSVLKYETGEKSKDLTYVIVDKSFNKKLSEDKTTPVDEIRIRGVVYKAVLSVDEIGIKKYLNEINIKEIIDEIVSEQDFSWLKELRNDFNVLIQDQKDMVAHGGEGYEHVFFDEITELSNICWKEFNKSIVEISDILVEDYFNYGESLKKDLSLVDGVRNYCFRSEMTWFRDEINNHYYTIGGSELPYHVFFSREIEESIERNFGRRFF